MKYFILAILIVCMGVGCTVIPPTAQMVPMMDADGNQLCDKQFYVATTGTQEGGGVMGSIIAVENPDGSVSPVGSFTGISFVGQVVGGLSQVPAATLNGFAGSFNIESGLRDSGNSTNVTQNGGGANANAGAIAGAAALNVNKNVNKGCNYRQKRGGGY